MEIKGNYSSILNQKIYSQFKTALKLTIIIKKTSMNEEGKHLIKKYCCFLERCKRHMSSNNMIIDKLTNTYLKEKQNSLIYTELLTTRKGMKLLKEKLKLQ